MKTPYILSTLVLAGLTFALASCGNKQSSALLQEPETNIIDSLQQIVAEEVTAQMAKVQAECACAVLINKDGQLVAIVETAPDTLSAAGDIEAGSIIIPFSILTAHRCVPTIDSSSIVAITKQGHYSSEAPIKDSHPMDTTLSVRDVIAVSSNKGVCQLLQDCPCADFEQYFCEMGIPNETQDHRTMLYHAIGIDIPTSPIHIAWLYHCLGQGLFPDAWNVASSGIIEGLHDCVWNNDIGTASVRKGLNHIVAYKAQSAQVPIMGKTGSSHLDSTGKKHRISFVGIFPEDDPQYTCLVILHAPQIFPLYDAGYDCGSTVRRIATRIFPSSTNF